MKAPCHAVIWYLLPAIGMELARELVRRGMPQKEVAKRLGITPAAVSYYVKGARGAEVKLRGKTLKRIHELASDIERGKADGARIQSAICGICKIAWSEHIVCAQYKRLGGGCSVCALCDGGDKVRT